MSPKKPAVRVSRCMTLSTVTEARLEALAERTGVPRGRIVDIALANVAPCEACLGRGTVDGPLGKDSGVCAWCHGARVVPGSGQ